MNKYHKRLLTLWGDSTGSWTYARVGTEEERMELDRYVFVARVAWICAYLGCREIEQLETRLSEVSQWERRLKEVANDLGVSVKF